jgi:hypothetical protein
MRKSDMVTQNFMEDNQVQWEDHLLERKTERQLKDIRRTAVAFANSVRPGHTAQILIGECDDGSVPGVTDPDKMQRDIRVELEKIYPPIVWRQRPYEKNGKSCLTIEIEFSGDTPHFGDAAWIRRNNESVKASEQIFDKLIAVRNSVARELMLQIGKEITLSWSTERHITMGIGFEWSKQGFEVRKVTEFFASFKNTRNGEERSVPLKWLELGWDDQDKRLQVFVHPRI